MSALYSTLQRAYNATVRPMLPRQTVTENGVEVARVKPLDRYRGRDDYEDALIGGLEQAIQPGDHVCVVGGGWGVSAVRSAWAGANLVDVYEPGDEQVNHCAATVERNAADEPIRVHHRAVGPPRNVYGKTSAGTLPPEDLPNCDVLVLDCEGAEMKILEQLDELPRAVVVEVHPMYGVSKPEMLGLLVGRGYEIDYRAVEHADRDVPVIGARRVKT